jgi:thiamine-phosphate pyrophosphorylase
MDRAPNVSRLVLLTPTVADAARFAPELAAVCGSGGPAADIAAVILRLAPASETELIARLRLLAPIVRKTGAALLLDGKNPLAVTGGADGVHVIGSEVAAARASLGREHIVGAGDLDSRHECMVAGEAGADYLLFGGPEIRRTEFSDMLERVSWWTEIFVIPCAAYAAEAAEIEPLARAGADYIALGQEVIWSSADPAKALAVAAALLPAKEPA